MKIARRFLVFPIMMLVLIGMLAMAAPVKAGDVTLEFTWEQDMSIPLVGWHLYISATSGVYTDPPVLTVVYDGNPLNEYTAEGVITSPDGEEKTYYFVLTAYDGATPPNESGHSKEVFQVIDFQPPGTPFSLKVIIKPAP